MQHGEIFKKYRSRLVREGVLKSFLNGLIVFGALDAVISLIVWLCGKQGGVWLALGAAAGGGIACGLLFYFLKYKPTEKDVARRIDALGLEERTVTMLDYADDGSYLALRQREDAKKALRVASNLKMALSVSVALIVPAVVAPVIGAGMNTVTALAEHGYLPSGQDIFPSAKDQYIELTYMVDGDGEIEGEELQLLLPGESGTPVKAVASDGWEFVGWDDRSGDPYRLDENVTESTIFTALFIELPEEDDGGDPSDEIGGEGQDSDMMDPDGTAGNAEGGPGSEGGDNSDGNGSGDGGQDSDNQGGRGQGNGAGYQNEETNQILDGNTFYGKELEEYKRKLEEKLANNEDLTPEERRFIELYFGTL